MPIKARINSKKGSPILAAKGVRTVAIDHHTTPKPKTSLPPILSAHIPPIIYNGREKRTQDEIQLLHCKISKRQERLTVGT